MGGQSWNIICFAAHQLRTTTQARDGMHHQQQAVLRNNTSDISTLWQFIKIGWAWRSIPWRSIRRSLPPILIGIVHLLSFGAASILASYITSAGNQVLVARSPTCGKWGPNSDAQVIADPELTVAFQSYRTTIMETSKQYVLNCLKEPQSLPECNVFKSLQLKWTSTKVPCPFDGLCLGPANSSLNMDTGFIDSRDDLGINAQNDDRVKIRRNTTCIPITTEGYTTTGSSFAGGASSDHPIRTPFNYTAVFYGPTYNNLTSAGLTDPAIQNSTYIYTKFRDVATSFWRYERSPYDVK